MNITPLAVALLLTATVFGQNTDTLSRRVEPKGGVAAVAIVYYKIDFNPDEIEYLRDHEAELIFMVDSQGKATLEKVNFIEMPSIVERMMRVDHQLPDFYPEMVDGKAQSSVYFLRLRWPHYQPMQAVASSYDTRRQWDYVNHKLDEFEYVTYAGIRFDMLIGGVANMVDGSAAQYIRGGGGMKFDMMFYGDRGWGGGMIMTFFGNRWKKDYPVATSLPQNRERITMFLGAGLGKVFDERGPGHFSIQFEPAFALQNIVAVDPAVRNKPVQALGFSPGFVVNYALRLGNGLMMNYYYTPTVWKNYLNFHIGARPMMFNMAAASGTMYEAGISYRMALRTVSDYKLK
jgi:hypothetical protein